MRRVRGVTCLWWKPDPTLTTRARSSDDSYPASRLLIAGPAAPVRLSGVGDPGEGFGHITDLGGPNRL